MQILFQMLTYFTILKITVANINNKLMWKVFFKYCKLTSSYGGYKFSKIYLWLAGSNFITGVILTIACLEVTSSFHSFLRKYLIKSQVSITIVCPSFFQVNMAPHGKKKVASSIIQVFFLRHGSIAVCSRSVLCIFPILSHRIL